jgi:membrane protease YdiL (CAAX protease family)
MPAAPSAINVAVIVGWGVVLVGCILLWLHVFSPAARARRGPALVAPWLTASPTEFMMFAWLVLMGGLLLPFAAQVLSAPLGLSIPARTILINSCFHGGMLLGVGVHHHFFNQRARAVAAGSTPAPWPLGRALLAGVATFFMALPFLVIVGQVSESLMNLIGYPVEPQEAVLFFRNNKSPLHLVLMTLMAAGLAPITEEFVFRAGLFRFFRTRLPRWAALLLPACIFATLHTHLPSYLSLVALGVIFSLAYERTGRIGTAIVAHALFNGLSVLRIFIDPTAT